MKYFGTVLTGISSFALMFGMLIVNVINDRWLWQSLSDEIPYKQLNEHVIRSLIYHYGIPLLIFGIFCICLGIALDKKNNKQNGGVK